MNTHPCLDVPKTQVLFSRLQSIRSYYQDVRIYAEGKGLNLLQLSDRMLVWLLGVLGKAPVPAPPPGDEWDYFLSIVREQDFAGYLYYLLRDIPGEAQPPERILHNLKRVFHQQSLDHLIFERELADIHTSLFLSGVRSLLVKGPSHGYRIYQSPSLRPFRDIDLLVCPDQIRQATDILQKIGFFLAFDGYRLSPELYHHQVLHPAPGSRFHKPVELHWNPLFYPVEGSMMSVKDFIRSGETIHTSWGEFQTLGFPETLLYASQHMSLSHAGEIRLIWMTDIALLIEEITRQGIWRQVHARAGPRGAISALERTILLTSLWFGSSLPIPVDSWAHCPGAGDGDRRSVISADMRMTGKEPKVLSHIRKVQTMRGKSIALLFYLTSVRAVLVSTKRRDMISCAVVWFSIVKITLKKWMKRKNQSSFLIIR
jgi:hypothetical protein